MACSYRGIIPEQLRLFDFPEPSNVLGQRDSNTTPTQSLFLMKSTFAIRVARQFAGRLLADPELTSDEQRIRLTHLLCFATFPTVQQLQRDTRFINRMQSALPSVMDLSGETQETLDLYGIGDDQPSDNFGRQCLLARRMVEAGVRHIELCDEFWDRHSTRFKGHNARAAATDQPVAGLLTDLRRRGLLDRIPLFWGGEFGRTSDTAKKDFDGRDHNADG